VLILAPWVMSSRRLKRYKRATASSTSSSANDRNVSSCLLHRSEQVTNAPDYL
jgi:hypothetical protein